MFRLLYCYLVHFIDTAQGSHLLTVVVVATTTTIAPTTTDAPTTAGPYGRRFPVIYPNAYT